MDTSISMIVANPKYSEYVSARGFKKQGQGDNSNQDAMTANTQKDEHRRRTATLSALTNDNKMSLASNNKDSADDIKFNTKSAKPPKSTGPQIMVTAPESEGNQESKKAAPVQSAIISDNDRSSIDGVFMWLSTHPAISQQTVFKITVLDTVYVTTHYVGTHGTYYLMPNQQGNGHLTIFEIHSKFNPSKRYCIRYRNESYLVTLIPGHNKYTARNLRTGTVEMYRKRFSVADIAMGTGGGALNVLSTEQTNVAKSNAADAFKAAYHLVYVRNEPIRSRLMMEMGYQVCQSPVAKK